MATNDPKNAPPPGGGTQEPPAGGNPQTPPPYTPETLGQAIMGLSALYRDGGASPQVTDAITQSLLLILGSGPSIAAFDALIAAQASNGLMYHNAVAHQQKTNLLGMAMTAKCVRYMMDPNAADALDESILNEELN
ncbi:MAG TPA: RebB family R body protein [Rhizomicrobium sp.]|nr:RebB family R body protein [Rhizomicrobium sp.]